MNYIVKIEGQDIPLDESLAATDDLVKKALAPYFPGAANALITRTIKDDVTTITIVKQAGSKGASGQTPLDCLLNCPGGKNPVITLYEELTAHSVTPPNDPEAVLVLDASINASIAAGERQQEAMGLAFKRLRKARPVASPVTPVGF